MRGDGKETADNHVSNGITEKGEKRGKGTNEGRRIEGEEGRKGEGEVIYQVRERVREKERERREP